MTDWDAAIKQFQSSQERYFGTNASTIAKIAGAGTSAHAYAKKEYSGAVVNGRFQGFHDGHAGLIRYAASIADTVLITVGSSNEAVSLKNPMDFQMRRKMILDNLPDIKDQLIVVPIEDFIYRQNRWEQEFQKIIDENLPKSRGRRAWVSFGKDKITRDYVKNSEITGVERVEFNSTLEINATDIRTKFYEGAPVSSIPGISAATAVMFDAYRLTPSYEALRTEWAEVKKYRELWAPLENEFTGEIIRNPFPVQFIAVDGLVIWYDYWNKPHILLIKRKSEFGNGKFALPGGFLDLDETTYQGAAREVLEETGLDVVKLAQLRTTQIFDGPGRSMRGRMITNLHVWEIHGEKFEPEVEGADDAEEAFWMPIDQVFANKTNFFSDHYHIIDAMLPQVDNFRK